MKAAITNVMLGLCVMIAPGIFDFTQIASDNNHITGPLVITIATVAIWEVNRNARLFNVLSGLWLIVSPFVLHFSGTALIVDIIAGVLIVFFSLIKGNRKEQYGGGWRSLFQEHPAHMQ